jgi:hypothetical protein
VPVAPLGSLFAHYFDPHYLAAGPGALNEREGRDEAFLATRLAVLAADTVYEPAASYLENETCRAVVDGLAPLFAEGGVRLIGGDPNLIEFAGAKLQQYDPAGERHARYASALGAHSSPPWHARRRSSTADIEEAWLAVDLGAVVQGLVLDWDVEQSWAGVPERLSQQPGSAFTPEYVRPLLLAKSTPAPADLLVMRRAGDLVNDSYARSFAAELGAGMVTDLVYLAGSGAGNPAGVNLSYSDLRARLRHSGALAKVIGASAQELLALRDHSDVARAVLGALAGGPPALDAQLLALRIADAAPLVAAVRKTRSGRAGATAYHRRVRDLLEAVFPYSLGPASIEVDIDQGRKRVDIWQPNNASAGLMGWLRSSFGSTTIMTEVKNYADDIGNPEIDQLAGRFSPWHGRFGMMICRTVKDRALAVARCRDVLHKQNALIVVLDNDDLDDLADYATDPGLAPPFQGPLGARVAEVFN